MKRSPMKGKSPYKRRSISKLVADGGGSVATNDKIVANGPQAPANIRVAVRVRPENQRELVSCHRYVI